MVTFVPVPIGNPSDITLRALRTFEEAELFFCEDTRESKRLLQILSERFGMRYPESAPFVSFHEHNQDERLKAYGEQIASKRCVFVSDAGMPAISDPGVALVAFCQAQGIDYEVLPGASAVTVAYAASGFKSGKFLFYGFLPHKSKARQEQLEIVMQSGFDIVLYEAPHRLLKLLEEIVSIDAERPIFLAKELSKRYERYYKATAQTLLTQLAKETIRGEWVVVIEGTSNEEENAALIAKIKSLDLPPKSKAKLLASLTDKSVKWWYDNLQVNLG